MKKRKVGRPKGSKLKHIIAVRVSAREWRAAKRMADQNQVSVSTQVRWILEARTGVTATMDEWLEEHAIALVDLFHNGGETRDILRAWPLSWRKRLADALVKSVGPGYHEGYKVEAAAIAADLVKEAECRST